MARRVGPVTRVAGWAVLAAVLSLSLGSVVALAAHAGLGWGFGPAGWAAIRFTLLQSLLSAGLSVALAIPFARALMRREFAGRGIVLGLLGAPFLLPVIVAILGLLTVWGRAGWVSELSLLAGGGRVSIYGLAGVLLGHVFFNLPLVTRLLVQGWQAIPAERFRLAAQLGLGPRDVFLVLEWPMLRAVLPGAFLLVFLLCMTSFAVALTLGGGPRATTIELAIYQALRFEFDIGQAARLALVQFGLCGGIALFALGLGMPAGFGRGLGRPAQRWDAPGGAALWRDRAVLVVLGLFLVLPLLAVVLRGVPGFWSALSPALGAAALTSVALALASALVALAAALALAVLIAGLPGRRALLVEAFAILMLAASPFVVGTGLFLVIRPFADPFAWALVITGAINAAMSLPFALRVLVPALIAVEANYGRLTASLGMGRAARFRLVAWPLMRRPLGFAAGLAAALSMGDLGVITLFAPPDVETLPLHMYRLMGAYRMADAGAVALILLGLSLAMFWSFDRGGRIGDSL